MKLLRLLAPLVLAAAASAQDVGTTLPGSFELSDFTQTGARSLADYRGRAVLLEFFAYW